MAKTVISNRPLWVNEFSFGSQLFNAVLEYGADEKDTTSFEDSTHVAQGGLKSAGLAMDGYWDSSTAQPIDGELFAQQGGTNLITIPGVNGAEGEIAYFGNFNQAEYSPGESIGEVLKFSFNASAAGDLVRGTIELKQSALSSSGNSTGRQLGALSATQRLWAALHVTAVSGTTPTFDAIVQSDDNGSFTSPTTRITFTQATAITSELLSVAGAVTDDYWRINYTIAGTAPSFTVALVLGILTEGT